MDDSLFFIYHHPFKVTQDGPFCIIYYGPLKGYSKSLHMADGYRQAYWHTAAPITPFCITYSIFPILQNIQPEYKQKACQPRAKHV